MHRHMHTHVRMRMHIHVHMRMLMHMHMHMHTRGPAGRNGRKRAWTTSAYETIEIRSPAGTDGTPGAIRGQRWHTDQTAVEYIPRLYRP